MRFRAISSFAISIVLCAGAALGTIVTGGCGSGHTTVATSSTPTPTPTPTPVTPTLVKATIVWPIRSRQASVTSTVAIAALASASSAVIDISGAQASGSDIVISANRPTGAASNTSTYTSTATAVPGQYFTTVKFYNLPLTSAGAVDPTAVVVATAQANVQIQSDGTLAGTITTIGQVQSVQVLAGQTIPIGASADIQFTAYGPTTNGAKSIVPVPVGAALISVTNTDTTKPTVAEVLTGTTTGGMVEGLAPGTVVVTVNVDNVTNDTTAASSIVTVTSNASVAVIPNVTTVFIGSQTTFSAQVANAPTATVVYSLSATSPAGATIDPNTGIFTAPAESGLTYTVVATSTYDPTKFGTATVTVVSNVAIAPTGGTTSIFVGANKQVSLPVTVTGTSNTSVIYSVVGNTGTATTNGQVTAAGSYTAPDIQGNYQVLVTSVADSSKTLTFNLYVGPSVTISPKKTTVSVEQSVTFRTTVVGGSTGLIYTVTEAGGGTVTSAGVYTAPDVAGVYHVVVTSSADSSQSDTATVTVQAGSGTVVVQ